MILAETIRETKAFKNIANNITQVSYYESKEAAPEIIKLVKMDSKAFGSAIEKIIIEHYCLEKRVNTQHDARLEDKKIEIKAARYWAGQDNCKWQHIEKNHDYEYILFSLVDFNQIRCWLAKKETVIQHMTPQGLQGNWVDKVTILPHIHEITTKEQLQILINTI
jgi:hypothetical protein